MDDETRAELYKRINVRLEAALESMRYNFDALCEIQSDLYTVFHLLYIANKDIEGSVLPKID